jgi:cytoskeletal protein CcmA (bactofilin family)
MRMAALVAVFAIGWFGTASAQAPYDDPKTPEGWAWAKIRNDEIADFGQRCKGELDPHDKTGWDDPCRQIAAKFVVDMLTVPKWRDQLPRQIVRLRGVRIDGTIDLADTEIAPEVWIDASRIEGHLILADSHWKRLLSLRGSTIVGGVSGYRMESESTIVLREKAAIEGDVNLGSARVHGDLELNGSSFDGAVNADGMNVGGYLLMRHATFGGDVILRGAKVASNLEMDTSSFAGAVNADRLNVGGYLFMRDHATFGGDVILRSAKVGSSLEMGTSSFRKAVNADSMSVGGSLLMRDGARFDGDVNLIGTKIGGTLDMSGSEFAKAVYGSRLSIEGSFFMRGGATVGGDLILRGAKVGSGLEMDSSSFTGTVDADGLSTGDYLLMRAATFGGDVILRSAKVGSNLEMDTSSFAGAVNADSMSVAGSLFMRDHANFAGDVNLRTTKVGASLDMDGSTFRKAVDASSMNVAGSLFMRDHATFARDVNLRTTKVGANLEMDTSSFAGAVKADPVKVEGNLLMRNGATFGGEVTLIGAKIGGNLHLWGSTAWRVDLSGADTREFLLGGLGWWCASGKALTDAATGAPQAGAKPAPIHWRLGDPSWQKAQCDGTDPATLPSLILRNFHVNAFQDSAGAWPPSMDIEGFRYERLGGIGGGGQNDMRTRSPKEWIDWLARDPTFSTQPYTQLSSVLAAAGHRDTSEAIQFAGRERERHEAHTWGSWAWLTFLWAVAGYGIGLYTFRVVWWVLFLTLLGAVILQFSPAARARGVLWRCGASLHRLLPVIELSKEFTDFFNNPPPQFDEVRNLSRAQQVYFAGHAILGWVLGFFLLAAMGGLTQKG